MTKEEVTALQGADPRLIHIESRVDNLEKDVTEIRSGVKLLLERPANPGFVQVISSILTTLATCAIIFGFAEWRLREAVSPMTEKLGALERLVDDTRIHAAMMDERVTWIKSLGGWKAETK